MPTEEVFTTPHKDRADGIVTATKPLSHQGTMIEGIQVRFEHGRIVEAHATRGQEVLEKLIDTDDGARRLGEVALVPHSSPIAQSGLVFFNTLFDENAASHIALGQSYSSCLRDGDKLSPEELAAKGANDEPHPRRLDDRLGRARHRRHHRIRRCRAADAQGRVGNYCLKPEIGSQDAWNQSLISLPAHASAAPDSIARRPTPRWRRCWPPRLPTWISSGDFAARLTSLKHHRGITHTFWAVPVVAGVVVGAVWLLASLARQAPTTRREDSTRSQRIQPRLKSAHGAAQPLHWGWLYLTACVAALSHSCSTGPTTTACGRSFRSIPIGMPAASCSSPSR